MRYALLLTIFFIAQLLYGQSPIGLSVGARAGITGTEIDGLKTMLIPSFYDNNSSTTYEWKEKTSFGPVGGFTLMYGIKNRLFAFGMDILYANRKGHFYYNELAESALEYNLRLKYAYIEFFPNVKLYPFKSNYRWGFNINGGVSFGDNIHSNKINYKSEGPVNIANTQIDGLVKNNLQTTIYGKANVTWVFGIGWDINFGRPEENGVNSDEDYSQVFSIGLRYRGSWGDIIYTSANNYLISNPTNRNTINKNWMNAELTIGFSFGTGVHATKN